MAAVQRKRFQGLTAV